MRNHALSTGSSAAQRFRVVRPGGDAIGAGMIVGAAQDVAIIGGGIVGTAAAAALAAAGMRVTLYESGDVVASGASGRNAGEICHPPDPVLGGLFHESLRLYRELDGERLSPTDVFRVPGAPIGVLEVAADGDLVRRVAASVERLQPDLRPEIVEGATLARLEPSLADGLTAYRIDTGYPVAPADATRAFAAMATRRGATINTGARAEPWIVDGVARGVRVAGRTVPAGWVIVAAGPWTPALIDPGGSWRPIRAVWGVIVEVNLSPAPGHVIGELLNEASAMLVAPPEPDDAVPTSDSDPDGDLPQPILGVNPAPMRPDGGRGPTGIGSTLAPVEPDVQRMIPSLIRHAQRFLPAIGTATTGAARACARPQALDGRPLIGFVPGIARLAVAAGNGAWGISTGPATARLVADAILTGNDSAIPPELSAARFGGIEPR